MSREERKVNEHGITVHQHRILGAVRSPALFNGANGCEHQREGHFIDIGFPRRGLATIGAFLFALRNLRAVPVTLRWSSHHFAFGTQPLHLGL